MRKTEERSEEALRREPHAPRAAEHPREREARVFFPAPRSRNRPDCRRRLRRGPRAPQHAAEGKRNDLPEAAGSAEPARFPLEGVQRNFRAGEVQLEIRGGEGDRAEQAAAGCAGRPQLRPEGELHPRQNGPGGRVVGRNFELETRDRAAGRRASRRGSSFDDEAKAASDPDGRGAVPALRRSLERRIRCGQRSPRLLFRWGKRERAKTLGRRVSGGRRDLSWCCGAGVVLEGTRRK
mmetsp:Transcript_19614/g.49254  ORF Transcript_19614/g.49254 Transcript_19614/m.49254 type:complete len:237 (-) Transcript_19614:630-1340(-)